MRSTRVREEAARVRLEAAATVDTGHEPSMGSVGITPAGELYMIEELYVTRPVAMAVPSYRRARTLIASTLAQLALEQLAPDGSRLPSIPFLRRPDVDRVRSAILGDTYADLCDYGVAYWRNPSWDRPDGWRYANSSPSVRKHKAVKHLPFDDVVDVDATSYRVKIDDVEKTLPAYAVIGFECSAGGWLRDGARVVSTARLLENAARMYARTPQPTTVVKNNGPRKTPDQVTELLDALEIARRDRAIAYVGRDVELEAFGFDAKQIALAEARAAATLDMARLTGVPAAYLSQGIADSSMQYSTTTQQRLDLHATMLPYATAVEERLSFDDVTGDGVTVRHDFAPFLRVDPMLRAELAAIYVPLEVMTPDEARQLEQLLPGGKPL
jgi:hypothetical protein